ncbi:MAG: hemolysin family protein [Verrucomicrobiota bacterium]
MTAGEALLQVYSIGDVATTWEGRTATSVIWLAIVILVFLLLNGFFVAAEFAIVKVRAAQLDRSLDEGHKSAKLARHIQDNLDTYLSANQLGITFSTIALGFLGAAWVSRLVQPAFFYIDPEVSDWVVLGSSFFISYSVVTFLHVVVGEQVPKYLGIQKAGATSLWVARPLYLFYKIFQPVIWIVNQASNWLIKLVFRIEPTMEDRHHSADELAVLVEESEKREEVTETERDILIRALELNDLVARDIMTPRSEVVSLDAGDPFDANLSKAIESKHTRFPLVDGHLDGALGLIHIKDMLALMGSEGANLQERIRRELILVPELMPLDRLLKFFLNRHAHLALVVDEFGGALGIVTLDNVLEELVGDIQDEFDSEESQFERVSDEEFMVEGTLALYELADHTELELESPDVSTVGGYITHMLGHLPEEGETVVIEGYEATITKTDGKRVVQVRFAKLPPRLEGLSEGASAEETEAAKSAI